MTPMEMYLNKLFVARNGEPHGARQEQGVDVMLVFRSSAQAMLKGKLFQTDVPGIFKMLAFHQVDPKNPHAVAALDHYFEAPEVVQVIEVNTSAQPKIITPQSGILIPS